MASPSSSEREATSASRRIASTRVIRWSLMVCVREACPSQGDPPNPAALHTALSPAAPAAVRHHRLSPRPTCGVGGGKLLWWVGACRPFSNDTRDSRRQADEAAQLRAVGKSSTHVSKCGNPIPPMPPLSARERTDDASSSDDYADEDGTRVTTGRQLTPINVTTYGWYYSF